MEFNENKGENWATGTDAFLRLTASHVSLRCHIQTEMKITSSSIFVKNTKNYKEVLETHTTDWVKGKMTQQGKELTLWNLKGTPQLLAFLSLHVHSLNRDR